MRIPQSQSLCNFDQDSALNVTPLAGWSKERRCSDFCLARRNVKASSYVIARVRNLLQLYPNHDDWIPPRFYSLRPEPRVCQSDGLVVQLGRVR